MKNATLNTSVVWTVTPKKELSPQQIYNRLVKIADAEREKKALDEKIQSLRAEIIGGADALDISDKRFSVKYTPVLTSRIDTKRLKAEKPEVFAEYSKESASARFSYTLK